MLGEEFIGALLKNNSLLKDKDIRDSVEMIFTLLVFFVFFYGWIKLSDAIDHTDKRCYAIQEAGARVFKINTCTGTYEEIKLK